MNSTKTCHYLNDYWVLWSHDLDNDHWSLNDYQPVFSFNTVEDFWILYNNINHWHGQMYYLMRQGIPPMWEHPININGGGWTFRIDKKYADELWIKLSTFCIGETLSANSENISGISLSPKLRNVIIRVWTKTNTVNPHDFDQIKKETENDAIVVDFNNAIYTPNKEKL